MFQSVLRHESPNRDEISLAAEWYESSDEMSSEMVCRRDSSRNLSPDRMAFLAREASRESATT